MGDSTPIDSPAIQDRPSVPATDAVPSVAALPNANNELGDQDVAMGGQEDAALRSAKPIDGATVCTASCLTVLKLRFTSLFFNCAWTHLSTSQANQLAQANLNLRPLPAHLSHRATHWTNTSSHKPPSSLSFVHAACWSIIQDGLRPPNRPLLSSKPFFRNLQP